MIAHGLPVINIGIGSPDISPPQVVIKTLQQSLTLPDAHRYQPYKGIDRLRSAISYYYEKHFNCKLNPDSEILPLHGSKEGILHISMSFLNPGDNVLVPDPGYPSYRACSRLAGAMVKPYTLTAKNNWQPEVAELEHLADENTKILWLNYPHMPTGARSNDKIMDDVVRWALNRKILIVNDNPYCFILNTNRKSIFNTPRAKECSIELNSLSKSHAIPGWRVGMVLGDASLINGILRFKSNMDSGQFRSIQEAVITALHIGEGWFEKNDEIYDQRRRIIYRLLEDIGFQYERDTAGLFVWSKVNEAFKNGVEASDFFLYQCHVFVPPGIVFGKNGEQYVRWSLCSSRQLLEEAAERIRVALKNHP